VTTLAVLVLRTSSQSAARGRELLSLQQAIDQAAPGAVIDVERFGAGTVHRGIWIDKPLELVRGRFAPDAWGTTIAVHRTSGSSPGRVVLRLCRIESSLVYHPPYGSSVPASGAASVASWAEVGASAFDLVLVNCDVRAWRSGVLGERVAIVGSVVEVDDGQASALPSCFGDSSRGAVAAAWLAVVDSHIVAGDAGSGLWTQQDGSPCGPTVTTDPCLTPGASAAWAFHHGWTARSTFIGGRATQWTDLGCEGPRGLELQGAWSDLGP